MANVLIIDDDRVFCDFLSRRINRLGHNTVFTLTLEDGLNMANSREFDVILLDVQLPDGNGIQSIPQFQELDYSPEIIIITGSGNPNGAELAIEWGAWDYIEKPSSGEAITLPLIRAIEYRKEKANIDTTLVLKRDDIVGSSPEIKSCLNLIAQASSSDVSVLIQGETGTGKELLAGAIHLNSRRSSQPFIVVDCGAIPESLVEGLLFGHEKGIFTGADKKQIGLVEQAHNGTLFLDEVGELPLSIQKAFLRVLQEKKYRPLGSKIERASDFRLISATNRQLGKMVRENTFREDLLYRIQSFSVISPPLRERPEDISELSMYHVAKQCQNMDIPMKAFSPDFFEAIESYEWPGNVRELFNTIDSAMASAGEQPILFPQHLPVKIRKKITTFGLKRHTDQTLIQDSVSEVSSNLDDSLGTYKNFRDHLLDAGERYYFLKICEQAKGNVKDACNITGLSQSRLYFFMQKHTISLSDFKQ
jgi:two-component system, NtrC family, response regulator